MNSILGKLPASAKQEAKYRQITHHLRGLISRGELKPGTRLPAIKTLAKEWDTNYFTVRLALNPLANEGLIERNHGSGTFVRDYKTQLNTVAIYYGANLWTDSEGLFSQRLYHELLAQSGDRGIRPQAFIDTRPLDRQNSAPPDLAKAIDQREVQGVIGLMLNRENISWIRDLGIPTSLLSGARDGGPHIDFEAMNQTALGRLAADGCRTVGVIGQVPECHEEGFFSHFEKGAGALGMKADPGWLQSHCPPGESGEDFGYQAFKEIWARNVRPEGLFIHHDWVCRGAITAILELGVRIPQDLRLVLYRNRGIAYRCPWPVPFLELDITQVAQALVEVVVQHHRGGRLDRVPAIQLSLVG